MPPFFFPIELVLILLPLPHERDQHLKAVLHSLAILALTLPLLGQTEDTAEPERSSFGSAAELQYYNFGNFFQAREGQPEHSVAAVGAAYRALWTRPAMSPDIYGRLSVLRYSGGASDTSFTGQIGISKYATAHWYDVALEHTANGYAFDTEETRATAAITSLRGHYSYGVTRDWRVGTDAYLEQQRFDVETGFENDYVSLGGQVRYRGFGDIFQPRIGFGIADRDVRNDVDSYDEQFWWVELRSEPRTFLDVSLRYRDRGRDYKVVDRDETRDQWRLRVLVRQSQRIQWDASYTKEAVDSSLAGRDFDRSTAYVGLAYAF